MTQEMVWFRRDLRLSDNPAWSEGSSADTVWPVYVIDPALWDRVSARRRAVLSAGLRSLDADLRRRGGRLRIETGDPTELIPRLVHELSVERVHLNAEVTPYGRRRDSQVATLVETVEHTGHYIHPPGSLLTRDGQAYRVFTAFHRAWMELDPAGPRFEGGALVATEPGVGVPATGPSPITAGEAAASERLEDFVIRADGYTVERDRPDLDATSHLSVDLKFGFISAREVLRRVGSQSGGRAAFVRQLAWRDFHAHLLAAAPEIVNQSMRPEYRGMAWEHDPDALECWKRGTTGYPLVDAAMRQLVAEGWIHNRLRMAAASFLVKDLLVDWRIGERFFRHHLLDGDVAQNVGNWQWVAGTGTDAAPYFRILNPVTQSRRFDPTGTYIRRWVPELGSMSDRAIHAPWEADPAELAAAGIRLGSEYPRPIVDHARARETALATYRGARERYRSEGSR